MPRGQGPPEQSTDSMAVYFTPFSSSLGSVFLRMRCVCRMCGVRIVCAIFLPRPTLAACFALLYSVADYSPDYRRG